MKLGSTAQGSDSRFPAGEDLQVLVRTPLEIRYAKSEGKLGATRMKMLGVILENPGDTFFPFIARAGETARSGCGDYCAHGPGTGVWKSCGIFGGPAFSFHHADYAVHGVESGVSGKAVAGASDTARRGDGSAQFASVANGVASGSHYRAFKIS